MKKHKFQFNGKVFFIISFLVLCISTGAFADYATNLVFSGYLQDSSGDIDVGFYSAPVVYDWNSDGKKDLLIGQRYDHPTEGQNGYVSFYENTGSNQAPFFSGPALIQACSDTCNLTVPGEG